MAENRIREVFPYLRTRNAAAAIEFYKQAFGAVEDFRLSEPSGRIGHAELKFGEAIVMLSDEYPEYGIHGPRNSVPTGSSVHLHVDDVDAMTQKAVAAGAQLIMEPKDQFYGERSSKILDPFGHEWLLGSHIEDVSPAEMQRRFDEMFKA
jgi:PhnB protein